MSSTSCSGLPPLASASFDTAAGVAWPPSSRSMISAASALVSGSTLTGARSPLSQSAAHAVWHSRDVRRGQDRREPSGLHEPEDHEQGGRINVFDAVDQQRTGGAPTGERIDDPGWTARHGDGEVGDAEEQPQRHVAAYAVSCEHRGRRAALLQRCAGGAQHPGLPCPVRARDHKPASGRSVLLLQQVEQLLTPHRSRQCDP